MLWPLVLFLCVSIGKHSAQSCIGRDDDDFLYEFETAGSKELARGAVATAEETVLPPGLKVVIFDTEYTNIWINSVGIISFGFQFTSYQSLFCVSDPAIPLPGAFSIFPSIIPYYQDYIVECVGSMHYELITDPNSQTFSRATQDVNDLFGEAGFTPTFVYVATWNDVSPINRCLDADPADGQTFQVVIVADNAKTFVIRKYKTLVLNPYTSDTLVGINTGNAAEPGYADDKACSDDAVDIVDESNVGPDCPGTFADRMFSFVEETCQAPELNLAHMSASSTGEGATEGDTITLTCNDGYQLITGIDDSGQLTFGDMELTLTCNGETWDGFYQVEGHGLGCGFTGVCQEGKVLGCDRCKGETLAECDTQSTFETLFSDSSSSSSSRSKKKRKHKRRKHKKSKKSRRSRRSTGSSASSEKSTRSRRSTASTASSDSTNCDYDQRCVTVFTIKKNGDKRVKKRCGSSDECDGAHEEGGCNFDTMELNTKCFECTEPTCRVASSYISYQ